MSAATAATCAALGVVAGSLTPRLAHRLYVQDGAGPPVWLMALVGAASFGLLGWAMGPAPVLPAYVGVAGLGLLLAFIDLACLRLPDPLVGAAFVVGASPLVLVAALDGTAGPLGRAVLGALVSAGIYLVIALVPGSSLGFGDVKLSAVLGFTLGWLGWPAVLLGLVLPHLINGPVALVLLLSGRAERRTDLPLGPALLVGWWLAVLIGRSGI